MILLQDIILVTRNARDKVQQANAKLLQDGNTFYIKRITGQYKGQLTEQALLTITEGKARRTVLEQATLRFNSIIKGYKDRGYVDITELSKTPFLQISELEMDSLVPSVKSDTRGFLKPMLAKDSNQCAPSVLNGKLFNSKKLDGVRCMMQYRDGKVHAISRGGKEYDIPTTKLREKLESFFVKNPSMILDGELYHHGYHLQILSGIARLKTWEDRCNILEYHIYDIADSSLKFKDRLEILKKLKKEFQDIEGIEVLDHIESNSFREINELHNKWVSEGYEGLVARKPNSVYGFGKRGPDMLKVKEYFEEEFKIVDISEGLRDEDFCFVLTTGDEDNGPFFSAKPRGDRALKEQYLNDIDNIIGKMGTVKFFEWSIDKIPLQPTFQAVRDYE